MAELLDKTIWVAFDTETTSLKTLESDIIEIGAVKFSLEWGIIGSFQQLIKPVAAKITPESARINNITEEMVADAPALEEVLPAFFRFSAGCRLIAHNAEFDASHVGYQALSRGIPLPDNDILDSLIITRDMFQQYKSHSLNALAEEWNIKNPEAHRARSDAEVIRYIIKMCWQTQWSAKQMTYEALTEQFKPIHFADYQPKKFTRIVELQSMIAGAIASGKNIKIDYESKTGHRSTKTLKPIEVKDERSDYPTLSARDLGINETRTYRIDRIISCEALDKEQLKLL